MQKESNGAIWAEAQGHLEKALTEVTPLMEQKFSQIGAVPEPDSDLDQCGLLDGAEIVRNYMVNHKWGLALGHLCYMVEETNLPISAEAYASLQAAGQAMRMNTGALQETRRPLT